LKKSTKTKETELELCEAIHVLLNKKKRREEFTKIVFSFIIQVEK